MRNAVWALSNLCRGKNPPPDFSKVKWQQINIQQLFQRFCSFSLWAVFLCVYQKHRPALSAHTLWLTFCCPSGVSVSQRSVLAPVCQWHRHSGRCVLGAVLPIWWPEWQNTGGDRLRSVSQAGGAADVRRSADVCYLVLSERRRRSN